MFDTLIMLLGTEHHRVVRLKDVTESMSFIKMCGASIFDGAQTMSTSRKLERSIAPYSGRTFFHTINQYLRMKKGR